MFDLYAHPDTSGPNPSHFSSNPLSRRQFLQLLLAAFLGGAASGWLSGAASLALAPEIAWVDLDSGVLSASHATCALSGRPGSLMKLVAATQLLEDGLIARNATVECRGRLRIDGQTVNCLRPHGVVDLPQALGESCNVFFAQMSERMDPQRFLFWAQQFLLDRPAKHLPAGQFPEAYTGPALPLFLGLSPSLQPTLGQLLRMSAIIATEGRCPGFRPSPQETVPRYNLQQALTPSTWRLLRTGMRRAARQGTGRAADPSDSLRLALKTGTTPLGGGFQSWVMGYFPAEAPRYAFCLRAPSGSSQDAAVPQLREYLRAHVWAVS